MPIRTTCTCTCIHRCGDMHLKIMACHNKKMNPNTMDRINKMLYCSTVSKSELTANSLNPHTTTYY